MKIYASKQGIRIATYKNTPIYMDDATTYIYEGDMGTNRVNFDNEEEARAYIDDMVSNNAPLDRQEYELHKYRVTFLTSSDSTSIYYVDATSSKEARQIVKSEFGRECYMITDVTIVS